MKVLWFSLSPGLSDTHLNNKYTGLGWIKSLEGNIHNKIDLSIVFYVDTYVEPFALGSTKYIPVKRFKHGKISKIKQRILSAIESRDDVNLFLKIINDVKPDIIHIHGTESPFGLVQKFVGIPTVVSIQGIITVYRYKFFSGIRYFDVFKYSRLKSIMFFRTFIYEYDRFKKMAVREQEIFSLTKHFIGRTAWDKRVTMVLAASANYYHNDEILRDSFYKYEWNNKYAKKLILFSTNGPDLYKGLETLLDCAHLLDFNKVDYEWHIAGLSKDDDIVNIAARSIGKPISNKIKFLGILDEQALVQALLQSHIYVSVSHIENSPNNLCEAQILGVPCIATYAGGVNSLLQDGEDGILIQDGDPYAMAGAIVELKNNYDKAIVFGKNARKKALLRHDPEKITNGLLEIYRTILQIK